jgi:hypothetical protein
MLPRSKFISTLSIRRYTSEENQVSESVIQRCLSELQKDTTFWKEYSAAIREAQGLDTDFPEETDGPVRRLHVANAKLSERAVKIEPQLLEDWQAKHCVILAAEQAALGSEKEQ